jgi:hypothetical protein
MAQATAFNSSLTVADQQLERIFHSTSISNLLQQQFPRVYELLNYNFEGTANVLCLQGAFQLYRLDSIIRFEQNGTDNIKTWMDYLVGIIKYLKTINDDIRLEAARLQLAEHIHTMHYQKFPYWPSGGIDKMQKSEVMLDTSGCYDYEQYIVGWSCIGQITVVDTRPKEKAYYTYFSGRPEFKILYCNQRELKEIENLATSHMQQMKEKVDEYKKPLKWKIFDDKLAGQK